MTMVFLMVMAVRHVLYVEEKVHTLMIMLTTNAPIAITNGEYMEMVVLFLAVGQIVLNVEPQQTRLKIIYSYVKMNSHLLRI